MAQLTIEVNGRPYVVGCEDGQEAHLQRLAGLIDAQVRQVGQDVGQLGETRLMLMGALLLADDLTDVKGRLAEAQAQTARLTAALENADEAAAAALDAAAERLETMAGG
jgi:cell division protein ZapA